MVFIKSIRQYGIVNGAKDASFFLLIWCLRIPSEAQKAEWYLLRQKNVGEFYLKNNEMQGHVTCTLLKNKMEVSKASVAKFR